MDRNKSNKGKRTKKDKISELKNITQNAGLDFVFDPIIDEYFSYEKTFSAYGLLVYIMGSERLKLIRKWKADSVSLQGKVPVEKEVVEMIKDPKLFCNATFFFAENLFGDIYNSIDEE